MEENQDLHSLFIRGSPTQRLKESDRLLNACVWTSNVMKGSRVPENIDLIFLQDTSFIDLVCTTVFFLLL